MDFTPDELETCLRVLQCISEDTARMNDNERFKALIAKIHRAGKKGERRANQQHDAAEDRAVRQGTEMVRLQRGGASPALPALPAPSAETIPTTLKRPTYCYICKASYRTVHPFYHLLCPDCAALNYAKRLQTADVAGRTALVTGGRIKIGYQMALRLLRDGTRVIVTTRFPRDAARRFAAEADHAVWLNRLSVYGLDLRNLPSVEAFAAHLLETEPALDIIVNNAAQTIKRPLEYYADLLAGETEAERGSEALLTVGHKFVSGTPLLECLPGYPAEEAGRSLAAYFPSGTLDIDGQPLDTRPVNSWRLRLDEVSTVEMIETHLVGAVAPFILNSRLKPLLLRSSFARRFIVNVSAMEGQFARETKTIYHPHTNMAKASLNMMTRTAAPDYATDGIYMNSVDTGWITDENPYERRNHIRKERGFYTPLDIVDGMARVYDPIARGINEPDEPLWGHFLKDYAPFPW
jgi:NAD(P)-dependent dehydrogenase (short-subunit alcohol dehydrogenase family)